MKSYRVEGPVRGRVSLIRYRDDGLLEVVFRGAPAVRGWVSYESFMAVGNAPDIGKAVKALKPPLKLVKPGQAGLDSGTDVVLLKAGAVPPPPEFPPVFKVPTAGPVTFG